MITLLTNNTGWVTFRTKKRFNKTTILLLNGFADQANKSGLHAGRVLDIDSIKVNGPTKRQKKCKISKKARQKMGTERSELYSKHFVLTNYGNYQCFLRPFPLSDLEIGLYSFLCLHQFFELLL